MKGGIGYCTRIKARALRLRCQPPTKHTTEFSRRYHLRGKTKMRFEDSALLLCSQFLETLPTDKRWHIEGDRETLILYRLRVIVEPNEIRAFLDETSSIARRHFSRRADGIPRSVRSRQVRQPLRIGSVPPSRSILRLRLTPSPFPRDRADERCPAACRDHPPRPVR